MMPGCLDHPSLSPFGPMALTLITAGHLPPGRDPSGWRPTIPLVPSRWRQRSPGGVSWVATPGRTLPLTLLLALVLALAPTTPAQALESDQQQPLSLEADAAEMDEAKRLSVYTGKVIVRQGTLEIRADQVTIHHAEDKRPELIIATGQPATYQQQVEGEQRPIQAEALRMEYQATKDEITLIDQAVVFQGTDTFRSDRIVYDRLNARVKAGTSAQGKERVRIHITPQNEPKAQP